MIDPSAGFPAGGLPFFCGENLHANPPDGRRDFVKLGEKRAGPDFSIAQGASIWYDTLDTRRGAEEG